MKRKLQHSESAQPQNKWKRRRALPPPDPAEVFKAYLPIATKTLAKALKKARQFEAQKLARKVKATSKREHEDGKDKDKEETKQVTASLEEQLAACKSFKQDDLPVQVLRSRIPKAPALRSLAPQLLSVLPLLATSSSSHNLTPTMANIRSRILANSHVTAAWTKVSSDLQKKIAKVTGIANDSSIRTDDGKEPVLSAAKPKITMDPGRKAIIDKLNGKKPIYDSNEEDSSDESASGNSDEEDPNEVDDDEEAMIERELARLGSGSDDSSSSESGSDFESDGTDTESPPRKSAHRKDSTKNNSNSKKPKEEEKKRKPLTSSAFLPSLASGYISYSDSDEDAKWIKEAEKDEIKAERKNRRGQRARRAIWEKKYGAGAKHVVAAQGGTVAPTKGQNNKQNKQGSNLRSNHDDRSRSTEGERSMNARTDVRIQSTNAFPPPLPTSSVQKKGTTSTSTDHVHPSWEAKRKANEAVIASMKEAGKGKKIVFD